MNNLFKVIQFLTRILKWVSVVTLVFMVLLIVVAATARAFHYPIVGDVEILQISMIVLIMTGLSYTQSSDAHISIGLLVDRFSKSTQAMFDIIGYLLVVIVCSIISWVFIATTLTADTFSRRMATDLLEIRHLPFKVVIGIGFAIWGLEALLKVMKSLIAISKIEYVPSGGDEK